MKKWLFLLLLSILLLPGTAMAESATYSFRHYTTQEGVASNTVRALVQDHLGLIWMGSSGGLDSFDGREVIHHRIPGGGSHSVLSLLEDSSHTLWVGTEEKLLYIQSDTLCVFPDIHHITVSCLAEGKDGSLWIGTYGKGIYQYLGGTLRQYQDGHDIEAIFVDREGRTWVADNQIRGSLLVFNPAKGQFADPALAYQGDPPSRICAIAEDTQGHLWLGTWNEGIYRLEKASLSAVKAVPEGEGLTHIHSLAFNAAGNLLCGSDDGMLRYNPTSGKQALFRNDRNNPFSLSNKFVYPILIDHEGGIWIGTYYGGVNYVAPQMGQFFSFSLSSQLSDAQEDYIVSCFCEDPDGSLWIGSDNGGLLKYDPLTQSVQRWDQPRSWAKRLAHANIHALFRQGDELWIGTYDNNLICLNLRTLKVKEYGYREGLNSSSIYVLFQDEEGTLWAGTPSGLCRYDAREDRFLEEKTARWVSDIKATPDGSLWMSTNQEGILERRADHSWHSYSQENQRLSSNAVNCLQPTPQGLYAGAQGGLFKIRNQEITHLAEELDIQSIAYDGNDLWLGTQADLVRYSLQDGRQEHFGANDGVLANLFSPHAVFTAQDGTIYMGTSDGFVSFYPGKIRENKIPPRAIITRFHASGNHLFQNVLRAQPADNIRLPWRMKDIYVSFAATSYCAPEKNQYAYMLEGGDGEWHQLGNKNNLSLNQLPAGRYRLHVKVSNNSGIWSPEESTIAFSIQQHPLLSNLAILLYVFLFFFLLWLLMEWMLRRVKRKSHDAYAQQLDAAITQVKDEERDDRVRLLNSLNQQLDAPISGIGLQLEELQNNLSPAHRGELAALEKSHRMLRSVSVNLRQMQNTLGEQEKMDADDAFIARLNQLITDNLTNPDLSVVFLAKEMAISRSSLFAKTKELTGETPNNLINLTRLNIAAQLLTEGEHTAGEICYMVGFSSPSYFSKIFLNQFGLTPHEWSKKTQER